MATFVRKMTVSNRLVLLTAIVTIARAFASFYNVVPNSEDRSHLCPPDIYCYSLQEIVENHSDYFTSNTILELAPGVYSIHREINLHIANVSNFVLRASDITQYGNNNHVTKVEISCEPHVEFRMTLSNSSSVMIKDVTFSNCTAEGNYDYIFYVLNCFNVSLFNTRFIGNQGAVLVQNSEIELKGQSLFCNNSAKNNYEGFLIINESSKLIISDEAHFVGNTARSGGALLVYSSTVHINSEKVTFVTNTANIGGAIALKNQSKLFGYERR